ncbi:MAG: hypothetical protein U0U66_08475 [Cytophagaceae bacterium]
MKEYKKVDVSIMLLFTIVFWGYVVYLTGQSGNSGAGYWSMIIAPLFILFLLILLIGQLSKILIQWFTIKTLTVEQKKELKTSLFILLSLPLVTVLIFIMIGS